MKDKYRVYHWSKNYIINPWIMSFNTLDGAEAYIANFQGDGLHKDDRVEIVTTVSIHDATEIDHGVFGFRSSRNAKK